MILIHKIFGLSVLMLIVIGCAQNPADKFNSDKEKTIQKWVKSNPQPLTPLIKVGMSFDEVSKLSIKAGRGPLMPPDQTDFEDIVVSKTQMDRELQNFGLRAQDDKRFGAFNSLNLYLFDKKTMSLYSAQEFSQRQLEKKRNEMVESQRAQQEAVKRRLEAEARLQQEAEQRRIQIEQDKVKRSRPVLNTD